MVTRKQEPIDPDEEARKERLKNMSTQEAEFEFVQESTELPPRDVPLPSNSDVKIAAPSTLSDAMQGMSDLTDMQAAMMRLFPTKVKTADQIQDLTMFARIDPNVFLAQIQLNAENEIMMADPFSAIDVNLIYQKHYNVLSKGLDSLGIWDLLELAGAAREEKRATNQLGSLLGS